MIAKRKRADLLAGCAHFVFSFNFLFLSFTKFTIFIGNLGSGEFFSEFINCLLFVLFHVAEFENVNRKILPRCKIVV